MLVDFNIIPDHSRIWVYASENKLNNNQKKYIRESISSHLEEWESHKKPLTASFIILEDHFIIIALDESKNIASGCSIDSLQKSIQKIEKEISISLMNRLNIFCNIDGKIQCIPSSRLNSVASPDTFFYDLTIEKKLEIASYLKPISDGWCLYLLNKL